MNDLLSQLRDIKGLDAISWWPPAPGWWLVLFILLILTGIIYKMHRLRKARAASWRTEARNSLKNIKSMDKNVKEKLAALSALLRQLAIKNYDRDSCAGLEGQSWLAWLAEHDPKKFDWQRQGVFLIEAPYAPDTMAVDPADIDAVIHAAERWIR